MSAAEEWRPVLGFEGAYEVSSLGRVRTLARIARRSYHGDVRIPARMLNPFLRRGYPMVNLSVDGNRTCRAVHVLVCEAWHGPKPEGLQVRHLDDIPTNLAPSNLAWGTHTENMHDILRNGRNFEANKTHCKHGHEYDEWNTLYNKKGHRSCRTCVIAYHRARRARIRQDVAA